MSNTSIWMPHVTVAAVVEQEGRFLMVEEHTSEGLQLNQPAGHWEQGESLLDAVVRETLEESAWHFVPSALLGVYHWRMPYLDRTYLRFAFVGNVQGFDAGRQLDIGIVRTLWLTPTEISESIDRLRSPLVQQCVQDYLAGVRFPLAVLR